MFRRLEAFKNHEADADEERDEHHDYSDLDHGGQKTNETDDLLKKRDDECKNYEYAAPLSRSFHVSRHN